jgi:hypothetical protein
MHVQVVTYQMAEISDPDFVEANQEFAAMMAAVPGLLAKVWLRDLGDNVYGGLYLWKDEGAYNNFMASELWGEVRDDDSLSALTTQDFAVMADLTQLTQPGMQLI